jgi:hypothetical protein
MEALEAAEGSAMNRGRLFIGMTLSTLVVAGCGSTGTGASASPGTTGGKVRTSSSTMCQAHGGAYNASTRTCSYTTSTRPAQQSCERQGGYYDPNADVCEMGRD